MHNHLNNDDLNAYRLGLTVGSAAEHVEAHLLTCDTCSDLLEKTDDGLSQLVRSSAHLPPVRQAATRTEYGNVRFLAAGGLGEVALAHDAIIDRDVALKRLQGEETPERRRRFLREAAVTGRLEHPGIAPVYGIGEDDAGRPCYAMRFVPGATLEDAIKNRDEWELRPLLSRFVSICGTVAYAHSCGVIHRDIKPANIAVGVFGETILLDWGLAQVDGLPEPNTGEVIAPYDRFKSSAGTVLGTPGYMAPEQAAGRVVSSAADIFSLGKTLNDILSVGAPPPLHAIAAKAMAIAPNERYSDAQSLAADVERWLADEPVVAFAEPLTSQVKRWVRKHPGVVASFAASLVVSMLGLTAGLYFINTERQRTELARSSEQEQREIAQSERIEADKQRVEAVRQKDETESVLNFVENKVLAAARPEGRAGGLGKNVTLERAVAAALPFVAEGFRDQPLTEARLRMTMGTSFSHLGLANIAESEFTRARVLYTTHLGTDHQSTLQCMNNLAICYSDLGRHSEALALREEVLKHRKVKLGSDHPATLQSMNDLANSYANLGRQSEAIALRENTLRLFQKKCGLDHPATLGSMAELANSYSLFGRHSEAISLKETTLKLRQTKLGHDHPDTFSSMNSLATSYSAVGRHEEALALRESTLKLQKAKLGVDHPATLRSMDNLAISYSNRGHPADALALQKESLSLHSAKLGRDHPETLVSMHNLAATYCILGRHSEAYSIQDEALKLQKAKLGPDHPNTLMAFWGVIQSLIELNRLDEATHHIDEAFAQISSAKTKQLRYDPKLVPMLWSFRFRISRQQADIAGCRAAAEQFELLPPSDVGDLYKAAGFRAAIAGLDSTDSDAVQAIVLLKKAIAVGYKNVAHIKEDKDLDSLRNRADFKKVLDELEAKVAAKKDQK